MQLHQLLWNYWQTKTTKFAKRAQLEKFQQKKLAAFAKKIMIKSPYFAPYSTQPFETWPLMNKQIMMQHFDQMNTAGLKLAELLECAMKAEQSRDFSPTVGEFSVGLSSGTSNTRGVFVVSPKERAMWAGTLLAKLLPRGLFHGERVALFLRANNNLYNTVNNRWISFKFFDLFNTFDDNLEKLNAFKPTLIVAPAQVLRALALAKKSGKMTFEPNEIVSAAEVLEPLTKALLVEQFDKVAEVYQATEGFLAVTCPHGTLHLNEDHLLIEKEWIDDTRFVPIITDFTRETQPIIRYRLDDILIKYPGECPCGSVHTAISRIEGRCDDVLILPGKADNAVTIFADLASRALAQVLPLVADYQLIQEDSTHLKLIIDGVPELLTRCQQRLIEVFSEQGVAVETLHWTLTNESIPQSMMTKKRRIIRTRQA